MSVRETSLRKKDTDYKITEKKDHDWHLLHEFEVKGPTAPELQAPL